MPLTTLRELAEELTCPISQFLMVDPVIAADGHTYDRAQIEKWFRQQTESGKKATSPQTREPLSDQRLVSNVALKRTIERLVESGQLDEQIVVQWKASKQEVMQNALRTKRENSLARAPIGTRLDLAVLLEPVAFPAEAQTEQFISGSLALSDLTVDIHVATKGSRGGGGLFGAAPSPDKGRRLIAGVPIGKVMRYLQVSREPDENRFQTITSILQEPMPLPAAPLPEDQLLATVLPRQKPRESYIWFE